MNIISFNSMASGLHSTATKFLNKFTVGKKCQVSNLCGMYGTVIHTVMILSFRTDRSGQTVQTQIRLLLEEQSEQGLHCLPFSLHLLDSLLYGTATKFKF